MMGLSRMAVRDVRAHAVLMSDLRTTAAPASVEFAVGVGDPPWSLHELEMDQATRSAAITAVWLIREVSPDGATWHPAGRGRFTGGSSRPLRAWMAHVGPPIGWRVRTTLTTDADGTRVGCRVTQVNTVP